MKHLKIFSVAIMFFSLCFLISIETLASNHELDQTINDTNNLIETKSGFENLKNQFEKNKTNLYNSLPDLYQYQLGIIKTLENDHTTGYASFVQALKLSKEKKHALLSMNALRRLLELDYYYNSVTELVTHSKELEKLALDNNNLFFQTISYIRMAQAYFSMANDPKTESYLKLAQGTGARAGIQWTNGVYNAVTGDINITYGKSSIAITLYQQAVKYLSYEPSDPIVTRMADTYGTYLQYELFKAKKITYRKAVENIDKVIAKTSNHIALTGDLVFIHSTYGRFLTEAGKYSAALEKYKLAEKLIKTIKPPKDKTTVSGLQNINYNMAKAYYKNKEYRKSADLYANLWSDATSASQSEKYAKDVEAVSDIQEKEFTTKIDLLNRINDISSEKLIIQSLYLKITVSLLLIVLAAIILVIFDNRRINSLRNKLYMESITDSLTQLYNRPKILQLLDSMSSDNSVVALLDVDHFKQINDTYGHLVGDEVLRKIAESIKNVLREDDRLGRYGGEEFLLILNGSSLEQGIKVCERVRATVENLEWEFEGLKTSVSIGIVQTNARNSDQLIREADQLLYEAKRTGRNRLAY